MDRRSFVRHALSGLGLAVIPSSTLRAAGAPVALPPIALAPLGRLPVPVPVPATPGPAAQLAHLPFARLLDRARGALDAHGRAFQLRDRVALADFNAASREHRFHIVDLISGQTSSYLVAHGRGSDPSHSGFLQNFSNQPNSLATSEGTYRTSAIYYGKHGVSMRLDGLDYSNNNAEARAIVVHGADYVSEQHVSSWGKAGRSEGCFAVAPHLISQVIGLLGPGRMIYAGKV